MLSSLINLFKPMVNLIINVSRNRLINRQTAQGVSLLVVVGIAFGGLNDVQANLIMNILSGQNIGYMDIWIFSVNIALLYLGYRSIKLIARTSDWLLEEKILKKVILYLMNKKK